MSKTITISTQAQLQEYHQELQRKESEARKDKCILLALTFAGLVGVYALVINGINTRSADITPLTYEKSSQPESPKQRDSKLLN